MKSNGRALCSYSAYNLEGEADINETVIKNEGLINKCYKEMKHVSVCLYQIEV